MKRIGWLLAVVVMVLPLAGCGKLNTPKAKVSYAIGQDIGKSIARFKDDIDLGSLKQGLDDAMNNREPKLTPEEARAVLQEFQMTMMAKQNTQSKPDGDKNVKEGRDFLAKNVTAPGVKVTKSGLQYQVLKEGTGAIPKASDTVKVNYRGTLIDGKEFDSSYKRGEPVVFPVKGVIPGWTEALQLMKVGGKYKLVVPSELGYGARGAGQDIGPNTTLVFEVELLGIEKTAAKPVGQ